MATSFDETSESARCTRVWTTGARSGMASLHLPNVAPCTALEIPPPSTVTDGDWNQPSPLTRRHWVPRTPPSTSS